MGLVLVTPPGAEPITLAEGKAHLRVTVTDEDTLINSLIVAARSRAETFLRRALMTQTWDYVLDCFPAWAIEVPRPPLAVLTSVKYLEASAGVLTTLAASEYRVDLSSQPGRVTPEIGKVWPVTYDVINAVTVRFDAGYTSAANVPQEIKQAMLLLLAAWFENRSDFVIAPGTAHSLPMPVSAEALLRPYRVDYF